MSKITEYINLVVKGIPHTKQILEAVVKEVQMKYEVLPENERAEIIRRRLICAQCPFMSKNAETSKEYFELTGKHYGAFRRVEHCSFCGCGIETRTSGLTSDCGIETWNKKHPNNQIPLKWTKFNTDGEQDKNKKSTFTVSDDYLG